MVGVNAVIQTPGPVAGNIGIGFAVPINFARRVADSIIRTGRFERPWIGIRPAAQAPQGESGLRIEEVYENTPAARAGLQPGDVILEADGQRINTLRDLLRVILNRGIGERLQLRVQRGRRITELSLKTERMPAFEDMDQ